MRFLLYPRRTALLSNSLNVGMKKKAPIPDPSCAAAAKALAGTSVGEPPSAIISAKKLTSPRPRLDTSCDVTATRSGNNNSITGGGANDDDRKSLTRAWGQQCSPTCGCVVRFEASIDPETQAIVSASYHAKSLVTVATASSAAAAGKRQQQHHGAFEGRHPRYHHHQGGAAGDAAGLVDAPPQLKAVLTAKGRPMFTKCKCESLHRLSAAVVEHVVSAPVTAGLAASAGASATASSSTTRTKLAGSLEFDSTRSSLSFCQTALRSQGLPATDTHCFDVVEEAFTALIKRRLPRPRKVEEEIARTRKVLLGDYGDSDEDEYYYYYNHHPDDERRRYQEGKQSAAPATAWHDYNYDDDDSALGAFVWKEHDYRLVGRKGKLGASGRSSGSGGGGAGGGSHFSSSSTLRMFDDRTAEWEDRVDDEERWRYGARRPPPSDWVSYVDELYHPPTASARH